MQRALFASLLAALPSLASAAEVGGHVGIALPIVTVADESSAIGADFVNVGLTPGITVHLGDKWALDFEFIAMNRFKGGAQQTTFVVDPGLVRKFEGFSLGGRVATEVGATTNVGLVPIFVLPVAEVAPGVKYFVEADVPVFFRTNLDGDIQPSVSFLFQTGFGF